MGCSCKSDLIPDPIVIQNRILKPNQILVPNQIYIPEQILVQHRTLIATETRQNKLSIPIRYNTTSKAQAAQRHEIVRIDPSRVRLFSTVIASPDFRFDAASFLTKNGTLDIVQQLGPNTKNLDTYLGSWAPGSVGTQR